MSARFALRNETRGAHEALDAHFSTFDLGDANDYRVFLRAHAAAFLPIERALDEAGARELFPSWPDMRRGDRLAADLAGMDEDVPPPAPDTPRFETPAEIVGALYVLEGSRLGGEMLRRQVGSDLPLAYLSHTPPLTWREFVTEIERMLGEHVDRSRAVASANRVFEYFLRAAMADGSGVA